LLSLIVETFVQAGGGIDIVIDETLERRWGTKIRKRGHFRDSALSSRERRVRSPGLRWIVMAVVVTLPWTKQRWALPFLCVLATTPEVSEKLGKRHQTVGMRARQMVSEARVVGCQQCLSRSWETWPTASWNWASTAPSITSP
jgi:hypothetical protein